MYYSISKFFKTLKNTRLKCLVYPFILLILCVPFIYLSDYEQPTYNEVIVDKIKTVTPQGDVSFNFVMQENGVLPVSSVTYYKHNVSQTYQFKKSSETKLRYVYLHYSFLVSLLTLSLFFHTGKK